MDQPLLLVLAGPPGTGKSTLARTFVARRPTALLRLDVVETALAQAGLEVGAAGYAVLHGLAESNLRAGVGVVVDAVHPVPESRIAWQATAARAGARLVVAELHVPDIGEHRRRVEERVADIRGHVVPSWADVEGLAYEPWDEQRDGPRVRVDATDAASALTQAISATEAVTR